MCVCVCVCVCARARVGVYVSHTHTFTNTLAMRGHLRPLITYITAKEAEIAMLSKEDDRKQVCNVGIFLPTIFLLVSHLYVCNYLICLSLFISEIGSCTARSSICRPPGTLLCGVRGRRFRPESRDCRSAAQGRRDERDSGTT